MMEAISPIASSKRVRSQEEYKELWMSLFDIKVLSSCNEQDSDLFCASALLKTAFYKFIKLKKRLNETEEIIERQRLDLEARKLKNNNIMSKSVSLRSSGCIHCRKLEDIIQLPGKRSTVQTAEEIGNSSKETAKLQCSKRTQQNTLGPSVPKCFMPGIEPLQSSNSKNKSLKQMNIFCEGFSMPHPRDITPDLSKGEQEVYLVEDCSPTSKMSVQCKTPEKRPLDSEVENVSPILKCVKKSREVSSEVQKVAKGIHLKSPSLLPLERPSFGQLMKKDTPERVKGGGPSNPKNKSKISPDSLRLKKPQPTLVSSSLSDANTSTKRLESNNSEESTKSQKPCPSPEKEEVEFIMGSPVLFQNIFSLDNKEISTASRKSYRMNEDEGEGVHSKRRKCQKTFKQREMQSDTDATFFLPVEEQETVDSEDEEMEMDDVISEEEELDVDDKMKAGPSDSFNQVPVKSKSPPYRYQRSAVRRKEERRKLFGWECRDCQKYYEAAGLSSEEKKLHLNKCSRHRDKFSPEKNSPPGFWNPVFPDTPK